MSVEFIPAAQVRDLTGKVNAARRHALARCGPPPRDGEARYWETLFEVNAAECLAVLPTLRLASGHAVRYAFFGQRDRDLLVRPFVARADTDVTAIRRLLDWHPPPDAGVSGGPTRDVELLYRHFTFPPCAGGFFEYWLAMQELWASARWVHSHLIASADELSQITAGTNWQIVNPVETYEPAVVRSDGGARLAVLVECPLDRFAITLDQIDVGADRSVRYGTPVLVAAGPRGYVG